MLIGLISIQKTNIFVGEQLRNCLYLNCQYISCHLVKAWPVHVSSYIHEPTIVRIVSRYLVSCFNNVHGIFPLFRACQAFCARLPFYTFQMALCVLMCLCRERVNKVSIIKLKKTRFLFFAKNTGKKLYCFVPAATSRGKAYYFRLTCDVPNNNKKSRYISTQTTFDLINFRLKQMTYGIFFFASPSSQTKMSILYRCDFPTLSIYIFPHLCLSVYVWEKKIILVRLPQNNK